jgi:pimeloyl-ACP methyl ester carboxylesterase
MREDLRRLRLPGADPGLEIALLDFGGDGPPALLHHANGFCAALWAPVAERLRERFRVFAMDARGHGDSSKPEGASCYQWTGFGRDVAAVAERLAAEYGDLSLGLGHSFGGTAITLAAIERPELFGRIVLVDPIVMPSDAELRARLARGSTLAQGARRRRQVWESREQARATWASREMFAGWQPRVLDLYVAEALGDRADGRVELKCPGEVEATIFEFSGSVDVMGLVHRLRTPALILWAQRGNFPRAHFEELASRMQDGRLHDAEAGHLAPMEDPGLVAEEVLAFSAPPDSRASSSRSSLRAARPRG